MNQEHKDILISAAKVAGIEGKWISHSGQGLREGIIKHEADRPWNPITNLSDRYDLVRRCGLTIDFEFGEAWYKLSNDRYQCILFTPNDDESEALAILRAAVASKGE